MNNTEKYWKKVSQQSPQDLPNISHKSSNHLPQIFQTSPVNLIFICQQSPKYLPSIFQTFAENLPREVFLQLSHNTFFLFFCYGLSYSSFASEAPDQAPREPRDWTDGRTFFFLVQEKQGKPKKTTKNLQKPCFS